jgi:hypothetical protein
MRLQSFRVTGFAHFTQPVALSSLAPINVLHGANNGGKSTLLRAMDLYFRLLGIGESVTREPVLTFDPDEVDLRDLIDGGFHWENPGPITFLANWSVSQGELERYSLAQDKPLGHVTTELELRRAGRQYELRVLRWLHKDRDLSQVDRAREGAAAQYAGQIRRLLADAVPFAYDRPIPPFRTVTGAVAGFPQEISNALFDARQSLAPRQRKRWTLFSHLMGVLEPEIGPGAWDTAFERVTGDATLIFVTGERALPISRFGGGVQRFISLAAELALAREPWLALEEPEWRLSPDLQRRLLQVMDRILEAGVGPRQLYLTTHSPILGAAGRPFEVGMADGAPTVDARPYAGDPEAAPGAGTSLSGLLGLVEELADMEPEELVPGAGAETKPAWAREPVAA